MTYVKKIFVLGSSSCTQTSYDLSSTLLLHEEGIITGIPIYMKCFTLSYLGALGA